MSNGARRANGRTWVVVSSSFALIIWSTTRPNERFIRGGQVMMRAWGRAARWPLLPEASSSAAFPYAWPMHRVWYSGLIYRRVSRIA